MSGVMEMTLSVMAGQCFGENAWIVNKDEYTYNSKSPFFSPPSQQLWVWFVHYGTVGANGADHFSIYHKMALHWRICFFLDLVIFSPRIADKINFKNVSLKRCTCTIDEIQACICTFEWQSGQYLPADPCAPLSFVLMQWTLWVLSVNNCTKFQSFHIND